MLRSTARSLLLLIPLVCVSSCDRGGSKSEPAKDAAAKSDEPSPADKAAEGGEKADEKAGAWKAGDAAPPPTAQPPAGEWLAYDSSDGRFKIEFPKAPKRDTMPMPTVAGNLSLESYTVETDDAVYAVMTVDYPPEVVAAGDVKGMLDGARDGAVANINGKLVSEQELTLEGYPARRLQISATTQGIDMVIDAVICLVDKRLFQALISHTATSTAQVDRFLNSFKPRPE